MAQPLIVTADPDLLDDLLRVATAGGIEARVAADAVAAADWWAAAPLVLVGPDTAAQCARAGLAGRIALPEAASDTGGSGVILVGRPTDVESLWPYAQALRAEQVAVLPPAESWLVERFVDQAAAAEAPRGHVVGVIGGRGGAGASVLAAALAVTAVRRDLDTLLVDADSYGGGLELVLGWERRSGLRWPDLVAARGRISPPALVHALPSEGRLAVLSCDRSGPSAIPPAAMAATLDAGRRGRDLVVVDLPRQLDAAACVALDRANWGFLVLPAQLCAYGAAQRVARMAAARCPTLSVLVRAPVPAGMRPAEVARALGLPLAGIIRPERGLAAALARGKPPAARGRGPLAETCQRLLDAIVGRTPGGRAR